MNYVKLKDAFTIKKGKKVEAIDGYTENAIRCIQIDDLRNNNKLKWCLPDEKYVMADEQDILIAWDGANAGTVGTGLNGALGSTLAKLELKSPKLNPYFVALLLQSKFDYFQQTATGATIPHISRKALEEIELPVPSLDIQNKVVEALKKAANLLEKRHSQIVAIDELKQSVFVEMFGDITSNTKKFASEKLGNFLNIIGGYAFKSNDFIEDGLPVIKIGTANKGFFDLKTLGYLPAHYLKEYEKYVVYPKDLLITLTGTVGKDDYGNICEATEDYPYYLLNQRVAKLEITSKITKEYLLYCFKQPRFKKQLTKLSRGVRQANISNKDIESLELSIPPMELQLKFSEILGPINIQKVNLNTSLKEMQILYNSLLQKAFRGELFQESK